MRLRRPGQAPAAAANGFGTYWCWWRPPATVSTAQGLPMA